MLTCENLPLLQDALQALLKHLGETGDLMNLEKIQGPGTTVKLLRFTLSGKMHVVPEAVIDEVQTYPPLRT